MKKNKFSEESKEVLNLGNLHEQLQQEKKHKKTFIFPLILIFCGICLVTSGIFYKDIIKILNLDHSKDTKEEVIKENKGITILTCTYSNNDETLGLKKEKTITYRFQDNLLKELTDNLKVSILENSYDIGNNNINVYKQKYEESLGSITIDGLTIHIELKKEILTKKVVLNFETLDVTKVPTNPYLSITNKKDQPYREIKELEGKAGHICKVTYE